MSPKKLTTRAADMGWARGRHRVAAKYYEVARVVEVEDTAAINACVGLCILAGIAAGDAICAAVSGQRYSGSDHAAAAELLGRVDAESGKRLRVLVELKPPAHYGEGLLKASDRTRALRAAGALVELAGERTSPRR